MNLLVLKVLYHQPNGFWPKESAEPRSVSIAGPLQHPRTPCRAGGRGETEVQGKGRVNSSDGPGGEWGGTALGSPWAPRTVGSALYSQEGQRAVTGCQQV